MNADGEPLAPTANVTRVNVWLHALFSQIGMTLRDPLVTTSNNNYPYKAYREMLLSFRNENKVNSQHQCGTKTQITFSGPTQWGYVKRKGLACESHLIDMMGKLQTYILNHTPIKLRLIRSKDKFTIVSPTDNTIFKVKLDSVKMMNRKVQMNLIIQAAQRP